MAFHPYLFFGGTCRDAFTRYEEIFGGELFLLRMGDAPSDEPVPEDKADLVIHAAITIGDALLMGSDDPTGDGGPKVGSAVVYTSDDAGKGEAIFAKLAEGGEITGPFGPTFWSKGFGMCTDRFGVPWMVDTAGEPPA